MGRFKCLGSLKLSLWYVPQLSRASLLCFCDLSFPGAHPREWLQLDGSRGQAFCPSWAPAGSPAPRCWWQQCWCLWCPLFTDMAGNIPLLTGNVLDSVQTLFTAISYFSTLNFLRLQVAFLFLTYFILYLFLCKTPETLFFSLHRQVICKYSQLLWNLATTLECRYWHHLLFILIYFFV